MASVIKRPYDWTNYFQMEEEDTWKFTTQEPKGLIKSLPELNTDFSRNISSTQTQDYSSVWGSRSKDAPYFDTKSQSFVDFSNDGGKNDNQTKPKEKSKWEKANTAGKIEMGATALAKGLDTLDSILGGKDKPMMYRNTDFKDPGTVTADDGSDDDDWPI